MNMVSITREKLLEYIPEYEAFIPEGKNTFTALEVLELEEIPAKDRLWLVLRTEFIDPKILHKFACLCAERALSRIEHPDPRSVAAIEAKRKWMRGKISDGEMEYAYKAADNAAWDALNAMGDTAEAAACAAACASHLNDAYAADWGSEWSACSSEYDAERAWQVDELKKMLREDEA